MDVSRKILPVLLFAAVTCSAMAAVALDHAPAETPETAKEPDEGQRSDAARGVLPKAENVALDKPLDERGALSSAMESLQGSGARSNGEPQKESADQISDVDVHPSSPSPGSGKINSDKKKLHSGAVENQQSQEQVEVVEPLVLLGTEVPPATSTRLAWSPSQSFEGIYSATPVLVVNGAKPGPTLCLTAALHGDELNGIETVRRVLYSLNASKLKGSVIGVPIVNLQGFHRGSRYLSDRRDLNRFFPGDPNGSSASRIAYSFFHEIIHHCSAVVDLHTGSFYRTNLPQLRGDLTNPKVVKMTKGFGSTVVLHSEGTEGTLRRAAVAIGIPTVTLEAGAPMLLNENDVSHSVKGIRALLNQLGMVEKFSLWSDSQPVYYNSTWQRAPEGGIVFSKVKLGSRVRVGDLLGTVTNPITNVRTEIRSTYNGRILGMALNQVVQPGFATYHIGIQASEEQISDPEEVTAAPEMEPSEVQLSKIEVDMEDGESSGDPIDLEEESE